MRGIELTEELAEELCEVLIIIDIGEEATIGGAVVIPVYPMKLLVVELILDLLPSVVEDIGTLLGRSVVELRRVADGLHRPVSVYLGEPTVGRTDIDRLAVLA